MREILYYKLFTRYIHFGFHLAQLTAVRRIMIASVEEVIDVKLNGQTVVAEKAIATAKTKYFGE